tara:strand:- start:4153 stop:4572 length:420 start_codon:yes stop_codon:yes gene_type:complete
MLLTRQRLEQAKNYVWKTGPRVWDGWDGSNAEALFDPYEQCQCYFDEYHRWCSCMTAEETWEAVQEEISDWEYEKAWLKRDDYQLWEEELETLKLLERGEPWVECEVCREPVLVSKDESWRESRKAWATSRKAFPLPPL